VDDLQSLVDVGNSRGFVAVSVGDEVVAIALSPKPTKRPIVVVATFGAPPPEIQGQFTQIR